MTEEQDLTRKLFLAEIRGVLESKAASETLDIHINRLVDRITGHATASIGDTIVVPVLRQWREGKIERLIDIETRIQELLIAWKARPETNIEMQEAVVAWAQDLIITMREHTHHVYEKYRLPSLQRFSGDISINPQLESEISTISQGNLYHLDRDLFNSLLTTIGLGSIFGGFLTGAIVAAVLGGGLLAMVAGWIVAALGFVLAYFGSQWLENLKGNLEKRMLSRNVPLKQRAKVMPDTKIAQIRQAAAFNISTSIRETLTTQIMTDARRQEIKAEIRNLILADAQKAAQYIASNPNVARRIFISHSSTDDIFVSKLTASLLEGNFEVWTDHQDIRPSENWPSEIDEALKWCDVFVVVVTDAMLRSRHCRDECEYAYKANLPLYVVEYKPVELDRPYYLSTVQVVYAAENYETAVVELIHAMNSND